MTIVNFTPTVALAGGALIGLSAVILMAFAGRIMGISGIVGGLFAQSDATEYSWRIAFIVGVLAAPMVFVLTKIELPEITVTNSALVIIIAGLLVGFGASTGNGCTSGHGVCGLARLSGRSLVAVAVFMSAAFVTVFVTRHLLTGL